MAALIKPGSRWNPLLILGVVVGVVTGRSSCALAATGVDEAQIRAAMIFNLTRYVEWPAWKFSDPSSPFVLCFLANDRVGDETEALVRDRLLHDYTGQDRKVTVRRVTSLSTVSSCHILYISKVDRRRLVDAPMGMSKWPVLTISDNSASDDGSAISLPMADNRVQIVVDLKASQQSGLTLSSKLLKIATVSR